MKAMEAMEGSSGHPFVSSAAFLASLASFDSLFSPSI